jgi:hypothetical protein
MAENFHFPRKSGPPVSSTNQTDHHDITEILLKVTLTTINLHLRTICLHILKKKKNISIFAGSN